MWLWIWGIVTALALVVEFITADLITIWLFVAVSVILLLCTRKICLKLLHNDNFKSNVDALIGIKFIPNEITDGYTYQKFNGVSWKVFPIEGETLEPGKEFEICEIKGNKLIAKKVNKE